MKPNDETDNAAEHKMVKSSNWQEADRWLFTVINEEFELLGAPRNNSS